MRCRAEEEYQTGSAFLSFGFAILSVVLIGAAVGAAVGPLDCSRRPPVRALRHLSYQSEHILPLAVIFCFRVATRSPDETAESTIIIVFAADPKYRVAVERPKDEN